MCIDVENQAPEVGLTCKQWKTELTALRARAGDVEKASFPVPPLGGSDNWEQLGCSVPWVNEG